MREVPQAEGLMATRLAVPGVQHAPARHVYEKAGFTPLPLVQYYKALPGAT